MSESFSLINSVSTTAHLNDPHFSQYWHHFSLTAGTAGFTPRQGTHHTLSIYQRYIRTLYQRVTNWLPPRRSSSYPKTACQLWQAQVWQSSQILHSALFCLMLNRVIFRAEAIPLQFFWVLFQYILLTRFDQLYISYSLCLHSESALKQLNHETITKYKSSLLLLCHSDSPSIPSHLFFLFSLHPPLSHILSFFLSILHKHNSNKLWQW